MSEEVLGNYIAISIGKRKTGKTPYVLGEESLGIPGFINSYLQKGMKVLFVDMIDHPSYRHIPLITIDQIKRWKPEASGVYRIFVTSKAEMREVKEKIRIYIWNAFIVWEDTFRHERYKLTDESIALIGNSKQQNVDMMYQYHDPSFVPIDLYIYADIIEQFKTALLPGKREMKALGALFDKYLDVCISVNNNADPYFHTTVIVTQ